jgi:hypothetical protein
VTGAEKLNADSGDQGFSKAALRHAMLDVGSGWFELVAQRCPHLFANVPVFVSREHMQQMHAVIAAIERVVHLPDWLRDTTRDVASAKGVFFGYDFHIDAQGVRLIEINTNAGGGFLNALLINSQYQVDIPGTSTCNADPADVFAAMFANEWRLLRGNTSPESIAIVDEEPQQQFLFPEFLLAKNLFESAGLSTHILDPSEIALESDKLYTGGQQIGLIYNRLTDFSLHDWPVLRSAWLADGVVLTPDIDHYRRYADKRNLARLSDASTLRQLGAGEGDIAVLQNHVPRTIMVSTEARDALWADRRKLFFKPVSGFGSKGAYRGEKLTKRVFEEILNSEYVAQNLAAPGERAICNDEGGVVSLKYDLRCYVYDGEIQLAAARLYQGQTTNFRTPGGGFALVRVVE